MSDNLDALLDTQLDDLADLPDFIVPPAGAYAFVGTEMKADSSGDKLIVILKMKVTTLELVDPEEKPVEDGTEIEHRFDLSNEFAQGLLKRTLAPFKEAFDVSSLREVKEVWAGSEGAVVLNVRAGKQTDEQKAAKEEPRKFCGITTLTL